MYPNFCVQLLGSKAINGRLDELAEIIVHLAKVCVKEHYSTRWVVQVTRRVCHYMDIPADRRSFLLSIPQTFKEFLMDMHDDAGEDTDPTDLYYMLEAQSAFHTELMKEAFADLLSS
ncbi:F-box only protein 47 [Branchiostoma belcheri]|nr:F-box only protein 47 [Branchiostoma belcheri]